MNQLRFIDQQRLHYPVEFLCQVLHVVPSRYYAWRKRPAQGATHRAEPAWETRMVAVFDHHQRRYGTRRLQVELRELGHRVGRQALRTALRRHKRQALQPKAFVPRTTDSTHGQRCAPNLLLAQPRPTQANRVWVSDSTYLPLASGAWGYCCAFQDVCTKQVVGWQVRADMPEALVTTALQRALLAQRPAPGLIVHSDRGGQYVGNAYKTCCATPKRSSRTAGAASATTMRKPKASGRALKRSYSNSATGPSSPTWPTRKPAWPSILTTTTTTGATPASGI